MPWRTHVRTPCIWPVSLAGPFFHFITLWLWRSTGSWRNFLFSTGRGRQAIICMSDTCLFHCLIGQAALHLSPRTGQGTYSLMLASILFLPSSARRTHRPIPSHSFRQSYEAKSARAHQAFFQEFEASPVSSCVPKREDRDIWAGLDRTSLAA